MTQTEAEEFVRLWQTAESAIEVAEKLNIAVTSARQTAVGLRKMGIPLKKMLKSRKTKIKDYEKLREIAENLMEK